jgi:hypothetical protein
MENVGPLIIESDGTRRFGTTKRLTEDWQMDFSRQPFRYLRIDSSIRFQIGDTTIGIKSPFEFIRDRNSYHCDLDNPISIAPVVKIWPDTLDFATIDPLATLTLKFASGVSITVHSDPFGEAWEFREPGDHLVICSLNPGTISVWE